MTGTDSGGVLIDEDRAGGALRESIMMLATGWQMVFKNLFIEEVSYGRQAGVSLMQG
jgi:hypothetical protein